MRARGLALVAAVVLILVAAPSYAAPERSVTLTSDARTASWKSDFRIGPYFGEGVGCNRDALGCETTLIRLTRRGSLSVTTTQSVPTDGVDGQLILDLYQSDADGTAGKLLPVKEKSSGETQTISADRLAAGYYLLEVKWFDFAVGDYTGTAAFVPR